METTRRFFLDGRFMQLRTLHDDVLPSLKKKSRTSQSVYKIDSILTAQKSFHLHYWILTLIPTTKYYDTRLRYGRLIVEYGKKVLNVTSTKSS